MRAGPSGEILIVKLGPYKRALAGMRELPQGTRRHWRALVAKGGIGRFELVDGKLRPKA